MFQGFLIQFLSIKNLYQKAFSDWLEKLRLCGMFIREMGKKALKSMMLSIADISPLVCTIIII